MRTLAFLILAISLSTMAIHAQETAGEKAAEAWDKTKSTAKQVGRTTKETAKNVGRTLKRETKKVANTVVDAVTPDSDAHRVNVKLTAGNISMPKRLPAGKTAFVVTNTTNESLTFEVSGADLEQRLAATLGPKEKKVYQVNLDRGRYQAACVIKGAETHEVAVDLTVH
jgi:hypothetical protein